MPTPFSTDTVRVRRADGTDYYATLGVGPVGSDTASINSAGNIAGSTYASVAGQGNAAAATDTVLAVAILGAGSFDGNNRMLTINGNGKFAANANAKTYQCYVGVDVQVVGQAIATAINTVSILTSGAQTQSGGGFDFQANVVEVGNAANAQQLGINGGAMVTTHLGTSAPVTLTCPKNAPIYVAITGKSGASAANDVVLQFAQFFWDN